MITDKDVELVDYLNNGRIFHFAEVGAEAKSCRFIEVADKMLGSVGIQNQFIAGLKLDGFLDILSVLKDTQE